MRERIRSAVGKGRVLRRAAVIGLCAIAAGSLAAATATGQDSDAPPGASPRWLPCDRWVMLHWAPYDDRDLMRMLGMTPVQAYDWTGGERHTLAQVLRRRGWTPRRAAARLVTPWTRGMSAQRRALLRTRALRTLTQGHLAQHVLFHTFHQPAIGAHARSIFGVSVMRFIALREAGYTPAEVGAVGGRSRRATRRAIVRVWRDTMRRGVARDEMPRAQARRFLRRQMRSLPSYLDSRLRPKQNGPPPGDPQGPAPRPRLRLLCTLLAGPERAADPANYGEDAGEVQPTGDRHVARAQVRRR